MNAYPCPSSSVDAFNGSCSFRMVFSILLKDLVPFLPTEDRSLKRTSLLLACNKQYPRCYSVSYLDGTRHKF